MRKRLRKKLHRGEFAEYGFELKAKLENGQEWERYYEEGGLFDGLSDALEEHGIEFGGGLGDEWRLYMTKRKRGSLTEEDREWVRRLFISEGFTEVEVGPLTDAWK